MRVSEIRVKQIRVNKGLDVPPFFPISPHNHCDSPHVAVAHLKRERERECKCRVHWLEGVENSWLKHCAMGSNSFEVVFQYQISTHILYTQHIFCKGRIKKMKIENVLRDGKLVGKSKKLIPLWGIGWNYAQFNDLLPDVQIVCTVAVKDHLYQEYRISDIRSVKFRRVY